MTDEQRRVCLRAIDHFGVDHQKEKAVEELLELGTEIMHDLDGRARMDAIREELADVIIMAEQLRIIYGGAEVDGWIDRKLVRLSYRMMPETVTMDPTNRSIILDVARSIEEGIAAGKFRWPDPDEVSDDV